MHRAPGQMCPNYRRVGGVGMRLKLTSNEGIVPNHYPSHKPRRTVCVIIIHKHYEEATAAGHSKLINFRY